MKITILDQLIKMTPTNHNEPVSMYLCQHCLMYIGKDGFLYLTLRFRLIWINSSFYCL